MHPSVSVVIPTYNGAAFIAEALASVFAQTTLPQEIIVVDDCSKDDTAGIVEKIANAAPVAIRLIRLKRNSGGPAKPINVGVFAAKSELIAVLDQDDLFAPDKLQQEAQALADNPKAAVAAGLFAFSSVPNVIPSGQANLARQLGQTIPGDSMLRQLILHGQFLIGFPAFTFRKAHWEAKGGLDEGLPVASDYDLLCWLCSQGSFVLQPTIHYLRRDHEFNVCNDRLKMFLDMARVRARYLQRNSWLLQEEDVSRPLRDFFTGFGYWVREAGNYRASLECYRLAGKVWGWDRTLITAAAKLPLHWLSRCFHERRSVSTGYTMRI